MTFATDQFIADCRNALSADGAHRTAREALTRAVSEPAAVIKALGEPVRGGVTTLYRSAELTILNVAWAPYMTIAPHNHDMWAVIGIYTGREDNIFWRRTPGRLEAAGAKALCVGEVAPLGRDIIHSVTNPIPRVTGAIHIYGGDFFAAGRSEWDSETLSEQRWDPERTLRRFEEANRIVR